MFEGLLGKRASALGGEFTFDNPPGWFSLHDPDDGDPVDVDVAMSLPPCASPVRWISETIAQLPHIVVRHYENGDKERARDHPVYRLLRHQPNPEMSAHVWTARGMTDALLRGTDVSTIGTRGGEVSEIRPVDLGKRRVRPKRRKGDGELFFEIPDGDTGRDETVHHSEVLNIPGPSYDGIMGYDPIEMHKRTFASLRDLMVFGHKWFLNGSRYGGFLEVPEALSDKAYERLVNEFARDKGPGKAGTWKIIEEGGKANVPNTPPAEAQYLEKLHFLVEEMARIFNVPPPVMHHLLRATFSNIQHLDLMVVKYTLGSWISRREQVLTQKLFTPSERGIYTVEIVVDSLLRADIESRYKAYKTGRDGGWFKIDDVRRMEDMNAIGGKAGNSVLVPLNYTAVSGDDDLLADDEDGTRQRSWGAVLSACNHLVDAISPLVADGAARAVRSRNRGNVLSRAIGPALANLAKQAASIEARRLSCEPPPTDQLAQTLGTAAARQADTLTDDQEALEVWAGNLARRTVQAVRLEVFRAAGVLRVQCHRGGCQAEDCKTLAGEVVDLGEAFLDNCRHPPFGDRCRCELVTEVK